MPLDVIQGCPSNQSIWISYFRIITYRDHLPIDKYFLQNIFLETIYFSKNRAFYHFPLFSILFENLDSAFWASYYLFSSRIDITLTVTQVTVWFDGLNLVYLFNNRSIRKSICKILNRNHVKINKHSTSSIRLGCFHFIPFHVNLKWMINICEIFRTYIIGAIYRRMDSKLSIVKWKLVCICTVEDVNDF